MLQLKGLMAIFKPQIYYHHVLKRSEVFCVTATAVLTGWKDLVMFIPRPRKINTIMFTFTIIA